MFDIRYDTHVTERVHESVTVHEHRAPTDESVRLLREMEQAARDKVVQAIRLEDSPIDCVVHTQKDPMNARHDFCIFVQINGRKIEIRKSFDQEFEVEEIAEGLMVAVSERIAAEVLAPAFGKLSKQLRRFP